METVFDKKNNCYGCGSCVQICPTIAIDLIVDKEGFSYPEINLDKCTDCGLCRKSCPIFSSVEASSEPYPQVYAIWNKNEDIRKASTSGGVFSALAEKVLSQGGVVFGAAFNDKVEVVHRGVESSDQLWSLQGSKYTQSSIGNTYKEIRVLLKDGRKVLFSGTPCQVSGLYSFLGRINQNLYTCDCVCHGVPSPGVFELYKAHLEKLNNSEIQRFQFRNKSSGWKNYNVTVSFKNGQHVSTNFKEDPYMRGFIGNMYLRPSCHSCKYASVQRQSDITLADFWGIDKYNPQLDDDKGTSLILLNSPRGEELLTACRDKLAIFKADLPAAIRENPSLIGPSSPNKRRSRFFTKMEYGDFPALALKFLKAPSRTQLLLSRCLRIPKKLVKLVLRNN